MREWPLPESFLEASSSMIANWTFRETRIFSPLAVTSDGGWSPWSTLR